MKMQLELQEPAPAAVKPRHGRSHGRSRGGSLASWSSATGTSTPFLPKMQPVSSSTPKSEALVAVSLPRSPRSHQRSQGTDKKRVRGR